MQYRVESIGAAFSDKAIQELSAMLSTRSEQGWELHTVFSVEKKGCFGSSDGQTYLAVYRRPWCKEKRQQSSVTRERICQTEAKAFRKLKHFFAVRKLRSFLDS